jgi:hypothetical protein
MKEIIKYCIVLPLITLSFISVTDIVHGKDNKDNKGKKGEKAAVSDSDTAGDQDASDNRLKKLDEIEKQLNKVEEGLKKCKASKSSCSEKNAEIDKLSGDVAALKDQLKDIKKEASKLASLRKQITLYTIARGLPAHGGVEKLDLLINDAKNSSGVIPVRKIQDILLKEIKNNSAGSCGEIMLEICRYVFSELKKVGGEGGSYKFVLEFESDAKKKK